ALYCEGNYCVAQNSVDFYHSLLTVEAAVKLTSYPDADMSPRPHMMIVSTIDWSGDFCKGYELRISGSDGKVEFIFGDDHWWHYAVSEKSLPLNEWHTLAGQYDGKRISVYVDGQLWAETFYESTIKQCATDFGIGRRLIDQPFYFNGEIDEIAVSKMIRYE
ncbi:MAG: LamG domain-containing protein, partial [Fibrobacter sp.]|nr:LamG domain-containing protein [Fibrobacter sp.]